MKSVSIVFIRGHCILDRIQNIYFEEEKTLLPGIVEWIYVSGANFIKRQRKGAFRFMTVRGKRMRPKGI